MQHAVLRANKITGQDVVSLRKDIPRPMGIVAVHDDTKKCKFFTSPLCNMILHVHVFL